MSLARGFLSGLFLPQALNVLSIYRVYKKKGQSNFDVLQGDQNLTYRNKFCVVGKTRLLKAVGGSGNSRIRKFFKVETKNVANSSFQLISMRKRKEHTFFI